MGIRVRFAPSPTGNVHIGNIRTAIFNWLFARSKGGKFLLRIEDTDKERSTKEAISKIFDAMEWLDLDYDEEIYFQSKYEKEHINAAKKLLERSLAYYKTTTDKEAKEPLYFRIPLDIEKCDFIREVGEIEIEIHNDVPLKIDYSGVKFALISKKGKPMETISSLAGLKNLKVYSSNGTLAYQLTESDLNKIIHREKVVEIFNCSKISYVRREIFFTDLIKGELSKPLDNIKDFVILRSDDSPVFHIANIYDDNSQCITHIIRGDDHVENTYRHILLFHALGYKIPEYGHLPMIVNKSGKPYSKRDGDAFVGDFRDKGILPEALFNYLSLLGWSPGDNREKMSKADIIKAFTLNRVKSSPAQFDMNKLLNLNGEYIAELESSIFGELTLQKAIAMGWGAHIDSKRFIEVARIMQIRTKKLSDIIDWKYFFFNNFIFEEDYDHKEIEKNDLGIIYQKKIIKKNFKDRCYIDAIETFYKTLKEVKDFSKIGIESLINQIEESYHIKHGKLNLPIRIALTGKNYGADLIDTILIIGKSNCILRLENFINFMKEEEDIWKKKE